MKMLKKNYLLARYNCIVLSSLFKETVLDAVLQKMLYWNSVEVKYLV